MKADVGGQLRWTSIFKLDVNLIPSWTAEKKSLRTAPQLAPDRKKTTEA